ncbi:RNA methyltransferase [Candidatus Nanohalococcus occultus]|uniref:RNA methyltransferase n=1 Tax=Candidatus Nanohalococcus occultus TaxID=2978047 RepID=UPI0039E11291
MKAIVLIEPEIPENTGFIARLSANFGYQLRIVNPEFNIEEARSTAKNAQKQLRDAKIFDSAEKAVEDLDYIVGTKPGRGNSLHEFEPRENTSIMIGRESSGLSNKELELCDCTVYIPTSGHSSLNQSHATAVIASHFYRGETKGMPGAMKEKIKELAPETVANAVIASNPSKGEAGEIISELKDG